MTAAWVIDTEPSRRFPVYTRGNAGEVFPNVMTPMTGSLIGDASNDGQIRAMRDLGLLADADLVGGGAPGSGVFHGYLYGNLSVMRVLSERAPGMTAADADRQIAGLADDAPVHRSQPGDRNRRATARGCWTLGRAMLRPDISEVDQARISTDRWRADIADPATRTDHDLVEFVRGYPPRFADRMRLLLTYSGYAAASASMMERFADRVGAPPGTVAALTAGLGTIDSASPALHLWGLGRCVATSPTLTRCFDDGVEFAQLERRAGEPDIDRFLELFGAFAEAHGARGPDEWELASPTWGTDAGIALAAVDRLRHARDERDPAAAGRRLAADREGVAADVRRRLPRPVRPVFDRMRRAAALYAEGRERAKAVFIDDTYPVRSALFELAERARTRGGPSERRDCFLVTADELADFVADPASFRAVVEERRERRDYLQERRPPFVFDGEVADPSTWPLRSAGVQAVTTAAVGATLTGQGVCPGTARGSVRVVHDPADPGALEPGDILVAPITDPAWTPLFLAVAGVVVEVGAQQSHAAIVARELGIPAVVGVAGATTSLTDGQEIEIDGATGTVRVGDAVVVS